LISAWASHLIAGLFLIITQLLIVNVEVDEGGVVRAYQESYESRLKPDSFLNIGTGNAIQGRGKYETTPWAALEPTGMQGMAMRGT
jgi:hypothetical protein